MNYKAENKASYNFPPTSPVASASRQSKGCLDEEHHNKGKTMKSALVRTLAIAILLTPASVFAASGESTHESSAGPCATANQDDSSQNGESKKQKNSKKPQHDERQDSDPLLGIYG
jgi:hypothetical protein